MTKLESIPVLFRVSREKNPDVVAVFPTLSGSSAYDMTCYAHVGQHSACSYDWYNTTRPATPEQYTGLLAELRGIYEESADPVALVICKRITRQHRAALQAAYNENHERSRT